MFRAQNRETKVVLEKLLCPSRLGYYDDERDKTVFHYITPDLQDQDRFFWSQDGVVLRPTVSDHITARNTPHPTWVTTPNLVVL